MSTRGIWGLRKDNQDKITYQHFDSYPAGLGNIIKKFIMKHDIEELKIIFDKIILVKKDSVPSNKQIKECSKFFNSDVSKHTTEDWYALLRDSQGNPEVYVKDLKYMIDNRDFIKDSLFCEWGYIINLDTKCLEIYEGGKETPQKNRYKYGPDERGYYNCGLIKNILFSELKNFSMKKLQGEL